MTTTALPYTTITITATTLMNTTAESFFSTKCQEQKK